MNNINIKKGYGTLEFYKNDIPVYRLSKNKNSTQYSILEYNAGKITFFVNGWDKKRLIKEYTKIISD